MCGGLEISVVPRRRSIVNSTSRSGGNPDNSAKTSMNSSTTAIRFFCTSAMLQSVLLFCLDSLSSPMNWNSGSFGILKVALLSL